MATLLGPHLLDDLTGAFDQSTRERDQLLKWQPPVCLVLINTVDREKLAPTKTENEVTCLERLISETRTTPAALKDHIEIDTTPPITTPIQFINTHSESQASNNQPPKDQLLNTKVIGRIYLDDPRVREQIMAAPDLAAQFHHRLVLAARAKLNDIETNLADRVNYWVVVNEVLGNEAAELKKLGQYETKRMHLARHGDDPTDTGYIPYGCGLYALANANPNPINPTTKQLWTLSLTEGEREEEVDYGIQAVLARANTDNEQHR